MSKKPKFKTKSIKTELNIEEALDKFCLHISIRLLTRNNSKKTARLN